MTPAAKPHPTSGQQSQTATTHRRITTRRVLIAIVFVAIMAAVTHTVLHQRRPALPPDVSIYAVRGIDVSSHNGEIDFRRVAADSVRFVYIKATEGVGFRDPLFHANYFAARDAGLSVGAYHFYRFDRPPEQQARNMLEMLHGKHLDLPLAIDVEEWTNPDDVSDTNVTGGVSRMAAYLADRGYPVVIYTNKKGHRRYFRGLFGDYPLWICSFVKPEEEIEWTIWQYSHRGKVSGIEGDVDMNVFVGSDSTWRAFTDSNRRTIHK